MRSDSNAGAKHSFHAALIAQIRLEIVANLLAVRTTERLPWPGHHGLGRVKIFEKIPRSGDFRMRERFLATATGENPLWLGFHESQKQ